MRMREARDKTIVPEMVDVVEKKGWISWRRDRSLSLSFLLFRRLLLSFI